MSFYLCVRGCTCVCIPDSHLTNFAPVPRLRQAKTPDAAKETLVGWKWKLSQVKDVDSKVTWFRAEDLHVCLGPNMLDQPGCDSSWIGANTWRLIRGGSRIWSRGRGGSMVELCEQSELIMAWGLGSVSGLQKLSGVFMAKYAFSKFSWYLLI